MCGIAGILARSSYLRYDDLEAMSSSMTHRGPDDHGIWTDEDAGIGLAHQRLSILDLSAAGHQPMQSADGRYVIVFNGEIYNFGRLRAEIARAQPHIVWRGSSDTEVLLFGITQWGVYETLRRSDGMFALALWDREQKELHLARDRIGEKPLYLGRVRGGLAFSSELRALRVHSGWEGSINCEALASFLRFGYIGGPQSIFSEAIKLPPAHLLSIKLEDLGTEAPIDLLRSNLRCYWSLSEAAQSGVDTPFEGDESAALASLERELTASVRDRLIADVPLGAFLSGGIDSSLVVALMQRCSDRPVKTFTIGFKEAEYDEAPHALAVARHLGTEHTELYVGGDDALRLIPKMADIYDEPFADSSQLPTFLLAQLTRRHVTVALSGDGGDELFYGYTRYQMAEKIWRAVGRIPSPLRRVAANSVLAIKPEIWNAVGSIAKRFGSGSEHLGYRAHRFAQRVSADTFDVFYDNMLSVWPTGDRIVRGIENVTSQGGWEHLAPNLPIHQQMMFRDQTDYLPNDVLVKVDRASMAVSLEVRVPFLAQRVIELAWRIPSDMRWRTRQGKWLLRELLYQYVPRHIVDRPKQGFGVPLARWLRGPLRQWASDLLSTERLRHQGLLDPAPIERLWKAHLAGNADHGYALWTLLMLQNWLSGQ